MKMILLADVKNVGKKGEIVEVSDGYARNFLLPKKFAAPATDGVMKARDKEKSDLASKQQREKEAAQQWAEQLQAKELVVAVRVGEGGKLFGSVTTQDIAAAVKTQFGSEVDKRKITIPDPIKHLGVHPILIKLHPDVNAKVNLKVTAQEAHGA